MDRAGGGGRGGGASSTDQEDEEDEEHPDKNTDTAAQNEGDGPSLPRSKLVQGAVQTEHKLVMRCVVLMIDGLAVLPEECMMLDGNLLVVRPRLRHVCRPNGGKCDTMRFPVERRQAKEFPSLIGEAVHLRAKATARVGRWTLVPSGDRNVRERSGLSCGMADSNSTEWAVNDLDVGLGLAVDSMATEGNDDDTNRSRRGEPDDTGDEQCRDLHLGGF